MRALACLLVLAACGGGSSATQTTTTAPVDEAPAGDPVQLETFDQVWQTIADQHWDLSHVDWDAVRAELRPRAAAATSADELRPILEEMLGRLEQSHFGIIPGQVYGVMTGSKAPTGEKSAAQTRLEEVHPDDMGPGTTGLELRMLDGAAIVTQVADDGPAAAAGVKRGWIVEQVRDVPMADVYAAIGESYPEGEPLRDVMMARAAAGRLQGAVGTRVPVTFRIAGDETVTVEIERTAPAGRTVSFGNLPPMQIRYESRIIDKKVGYIHFTAFFDPAATMESFVADVARFRKAKVDGIVLDLRGNPGGIGAMAMGIGGWLVTEPNQSLGTMITKDSQMKFVLNPQVEPFAGKVAVLIDEASLSTSEILAGGLQDIGRARVFGRQSGGAALPSSIERLANGDGFQYAMANYVSSGGDVLEGKGVTPDVPIELSREALLAGGDPTLEAAVAWIAGR